MIMDGPQAQQPSAAANTHGPISSDPSVQEIGGDDLHRNRTVLKTPSGDIEYPGAIPGEIESPLLPLGKPATMSQREPDALDSEPRIERAASNDFVPLQTSQSSPLSARPQATRQWQTELPDSRSRKLARPPQRGGQSYLGTGLWQQNEPGHDDHDASSSSSDSDGDEEPDATNHKGRRRYVPAFNKENNTATVPKHDPTSNNSGKSQKKGRGKYGRFDVGNDNYQTKGKVKKDGRLAITVQETANTGYLAKALGSAMHKLVSPNDTEGIDRQRRNSRLSTASTETPDIGPRPRLNIVIMVIGSRGDAQPFLKIGKVLKEQYGHRVRIATHPAFREFVEKDSGLEFFSVGGDPSELMAFMVKNPGMIPKLETVKAGDIGRRRAAMAEMFDGFWRACINATDDEKDGQNLKMMGTKDPFVADAIIANPPSFAHIHCAEALGIPVHMMFTFPYTPTQSFPHPLASIKKSNVDPGYTNFISYPLVEMMVWQGLGDLVNDFRTKTLCLDPVSTLWAPGATYRLHVPFTYLWSPGLVPKPEDWGSEIDVAGFVFLDLASSFTPPSDLEKFLDAGEPPIYIGFGSIVVDDADAFTQMIFEAVKLAGVRALVSKGWGGLGGEDVPENIFMLENTPHDWLFPRVSAAVIHGGAGTTAIALKCGIPTMVVPFFGDQHFWGQMLGSSGAGPEAVPYKSLNAEKLAEGIKYCMTQEARDAVGEIAKSIELEGDGAENAVKAFHRHLSLSPPGSMRCSIFKDRIAAWKVKESHIKLSPLAADLLVGSGHLSWKHLRLHRHTEWNDFEGPGEPVTGVAGSIATTVGNAFGGIAGVPKRMAKTTKKRKALEEAAASEGKPKEGEEDTADLTTATSGALAEHPRKDTNTPENIPRTATQPMTANEAAEEYAEDVGKGFSQTAAAIAKAPVDLSMALAQGFHNAPRLYGDDTVRRPVRVTGIRSGLRAARKEFGYGVYDGFTGVVRLPVRGAKNGGPVGFVKGTGMGLLGFVLKNSSAIIGPFGYTLKGVVKQAERGRQPLKYVRRGRIVQGQREATKLEDKEKDTTTSQAIENWTLLRELEAELTHNTNRNGIAGHIDKVLVDTSVFFEDIDTAKKSLQELKQGTAIEQVKNEALGEEPLPKSSEGRQSRSLRSSFNLGSRSRKSLSKTLANGSGSRQSSKSRSSVKSPTRAPANQRTLSSTVEGREDSV